MSDAALKVDPDFYNRRLLDTEATSDRSRMAYRAGEVGGTGTGYAGGIGRGGGGSGMDGGYDVPELADYLVRQHSLLGFYLSLSPRDEADAERNWGFPHPQRVAITCVTVIVPLFLALLLSGSWLWKACVIGVACVGARLGVSSVLRKFQDQDFNFQGYTVSVWPHLVVGAMGLLALIWFVVSASSGVGWSTMWIAFSSLLFLIFVEGTLRAVMWYFKWWAPAKRFSFLKPWGNYMAVNPAPRMSSYAPPRPTPAQPAASVGGGDVINDGGYSAGNGDPMGLSEEISKAIGEDDFQSQSV